MSGALLQRSYANVLAAPEQSGISAGAVLAMALGGALGIVDERSGAALLLAWLHRRLGSRRALAAGRALTSDRCLPLARHPPAVRAALIGVACCTALTAVIVPRNC